MSTISLRGFKKLDDFGVQIRQVIQFDGRRVLRALEYLKVRMRVELLDACSECLAIEDHVMLRRHHIHGTVS